MKAQLVKGTTSYIAQVFVQDSSSTVGAGLTGLANNTAGLTAYYHRDTDTTATVISLVTMTVGTFTSSGFKEIDATNMPGWYQFCPPNAALASGAKSCAFHLKGATNMAALPLEIELTGWDNQDGVHGGLSCLPNTAVTTNASLLTSGTGTDQLSVTTGRVDNGKWLGTTLATPATAGIPDINVKNVVNTAAAVDANNLLKVDVEDWKAGVVPAVTVTGVPKVDLQDILGTVVSTPATAGLLDVNVKNINTVSAAAVTTVKAVQGLTTADTITTTTTATNLTNAPTAGDFTAAMKTSLNAATPASITGAVGSVTGNVGGNVVGSVASVTGNVSGSVASVVAAVAITSNIKKNQALAKYQFLMTDSTNHNPASGKTVTCTRSIDGGAFAAGTLANVLEVATAIGTYTVDFGAGDLNGNVIVLRCIATGCDDTDERLVTQP